MTKRTATRRSIRVLAVDVGGTHVKVLLSTRRVPAKFPSGRKLTGAQMVAQVKRLARGWAYDGVSIGFPGPVLHGRPIKEPANLGKGWVGFDFARAFGHPVKLVNDAAMQALGSYTGGRLLFLGLGTGLGSAMIVDGKLEPFELAHLPYRKGRTYEEYVGERGLERLGRKKWQRRVLDVVDRLRAALEPGYVVLGGGNAAKLRGPLPGIRLVDNRNAFEGGFRLWEQAGYRVERPAGATSRA